MLKAVVFAALLVAWAPSAFAIDDTPANRRAEAERYVQSVDVQTFWNTWAVILAGSRPPDQQQAALDKLRNVDPSRIRAIMVDTCIKIYTADELSGMAKFYNSPVGKAVLKKSPDFDRTLTAGIQAEAQRVLGQ